MNIYYKDNSKICTARLIYTLLIKKFESNFIKIYCKRYWDRLEINDIDDLKMIVKDSFVQIFTLQREKIDKND